MSGPGNLFLDNPSFGLSPIFVKLIFDIIREINSQGVSIPLVEQNARNALGAADRAYVPETGTITAQKSISDENVRAASFKGAALTQKSDAVHR